MTGVIGFPFYFISHDLLFAVSSDQIGIDFQGCCRYSLTPMALDIAELSLGFCPGIADSGLEDVLNPDAPAPLPVIGVGVVIGRIVV